MKKVKNNAYFLDGMTYALKKEYQYVITMDAGLSHNPDELPLFLEHKPADLVIGVRKNKVNTPLQRKLLSILGNAIYNATIYFSNGFSLENYYQDISSGYRRYSQKAMILLTSIPLKSRSFDFLFETVLLILRSKMTVSIVYVSYTFSNTSLKIEVVKECLNTCLKYIWRK